MRQTEYIVRMTKEGSTTIVNFMISGTEVPVLGHGQITLGAGVIVVTGAWSNNSNSENFIISILTISLTLFFSVPRNRSNNRNTY